MSHDVTPSLRELAQGPAPERLLLWHSSTLAEHCSSAESEQLVTCLDAATRALLEEDRRLRTAFEAAPGDGARYAGVNQGLGYWVFETALVYTIFKAWIPLVGVVWEESYKGQPSRKADLQVSRPRPERDWIVEAKWWMTETDKTHAALRDDAARLRQPGKLGLALWFWHESSSYWTSSLTSVEKFCADPSTGLMPIFLGAFPTHHAAPRKPDTSAHFCMAAAIVVA